MGWRFQKRVRVIPGITLNFSRKGVSTSIGRRGARVTLGHGKTRSTVGIPGTGISHTTITSNKGRARSRQQGNPKPTPGRPVLLWFFAFLFCLWFLVALMRWGFR